MLAMIDCSAFNEDGIEVRMSAEAWLDHITVMGTLQLWFTLATAVTLATN